jgi:hypothetical protein
VSFFFFVKRESSERIFIGIAYTAKMVTPRASANNDWFFQKVFGDGDFIAAGQLMIPPKGLKPSKGTKDNTYVCSCACSSFICLCTYSFPRYFT